MELDQVANAGYKYEQLSGDQIRVLELLPGKWDDELRARLRTVSRTTAEYEALSYVWGPTTEGRTICIVGGHQTRVAITDNLFLALRRLRKRFKARSLWVDAICINQSDNEEKSVQVESMSETYGAAHTVDVWLGDSQQARSVHLRYFLIKKVCMWCPGPCFRLERRAMKIGSDMMLAWQMISSTNMAPSVASLRTVQRIVAPWHTRAWTMQEYVMAQRIRLCLGSAAIMVPGLRSYDLFGVEDAMCRRLGRCEDELVALLKRMIHLDRRKDYYMYGPDAGYDIRTLVPLLRGSSATDPRDMVYSITALLNSAEKQLLRADYNNTYSETCTRATAASLASSLEILLFVQSTSNRDPALASWVVDFAHMSYYYGGDSGSFALFECPYKFDVSPDQTLSILGWEVGTAIVENIKSAKSPTEEFNLYARGMDHKPVQVELSPSEHWLGLDSVDVGDKLVRLCLKRNERLGEYDKDAYIWLRPSQGAYLFNGFGDRAWSRWGEPPVTRPKSEPEEFLIGGKNMEHPMSKSWVREPPDKPLGDPSGRARLWRETSSLALDST